MKAIKKPIEIEFITFKDFEEYGKGVCKAMRLSEDDTCPYFDFKGHQITQENDECYLISTLEGVMNFTKSDVLITGVKGEIYPCKLDIFNETYDIIE